MLSRAKIPGLFVTGTDTGIGKTMVAGAIAGHLHRRGKRVGVCKPIASGCVQRREGLVSEDAEFLAHHARCPFPLDVICPQRFAEPLAPAVAAQRLVAQIEWDAVEKSITEISRTSDCLIVEGVGGVMVPLDAKYTVLDLMRWLGLPALIVARAGLGTINHTLLTATVLRQAGVKIAGVVINQYPDGTPDLAEETNPRAIEKWGGLSVLCLAPKFEGTADPELPPDFVAAIDSVDWLAKIG